MTTALTRIDELDTMTLGSMLAKSGYFQDARDQAQAIVKVLAGRELGLPPIAAMTGIFIVKGRVTLSANLIAACIKRSGRYNYKITRMDNDGCVIEFYENGQPCGVSEFTSQDAKDAQLANGENWKKFPRNMYFARAMSNGAKWYCPDIFAGPIYTPDELGATVNEEGEIVEGEVIETPRATPAERAVAEQPTNVTPIRRPPPKVTPETLQPAPDAEAERRKPIWRRFNDLIPQAKALGVDCTAVEHAMMDDDGLTYEQLRELGIDLAGRIRLAEQAATLADATTDAPELFEEAEPVEG